MKTPLLADNPLEKARKRADISLLRLSNSTGISRTTLRRKMEHPEDLTVQEWVKICAEVGFDYRRMDAVVKVTRKAA